MGIKTLKVLNNDFVFSGGRLEVLTGIDALAQLTENRLKLWLGEWFLAPNDGIDYLGLFNQRSFLEKRFSLALRTQVLSDIRIKKIINMNIEVDRGSRQVDVELNLESDEGKFNVVFGVAI